MRNTRKGFTLVELLIVIAILGTLSAAMSASITGSTAKAKAAAIANNVETLKNAASIYYTDNMESATALNVTTTAVLTKHIATWGDFGTGTINYTAVDDPTGRENWAVIVDFHTDGEADAIKEALTKIKGYGSYGQKIGGDGDDKDDPDPAKSVVNTGKFKVTLWNGAITSETIQL